MLFDDPFNAIGRNVGVPNSVWPDQKNRPSFAHPEAISFATQNNSLRAFGVFEIQFTNNALQLIPGLCPKRWIAAFGLAGGGAEQKMVGDRSFTQFNFLVHFVETNVDYVGRGHRDMNVCKSHALQGRSHKI